jgi:hypothetical protein
VRLIRWLPAVGLIAMSAAATAAPPPASATALSPVRITSRLPPGIASKGTLQQAWSFVDKNGTNYVLFSSKDVQGGPGPFYSDPNRGRWLYVDLWLVAPGKKPRLVAPVRDFQLDCPVGVELTARFHDDAFGVTDLDEDGVAEVTFAYELGCRVDSSPNTYKLLLYQNGTKYIFRGHTRRAGHDSSGGELTPDPATERWPGAFYHQAEAIWDKTVDELDADDPGG